MALLSTAILRGTLAARPTDNTALTTGRLYYATDTQTWYRDNGTSWDSQPAAPGAHAASHASGGSDPVSPASIGAATAAALTAHTGNTSNPHAVTAAQAGAEPAAGNPSADGYIWSSTAAGVRSWIAPPTGGGGAAAFVGCHVYHNANQSIATGGANTTPLAFNSERFDTDNFHDTATNNSRLTIPTGKAGKYVATISVAWDLSTTGTRQLRLVKNGTAAVAFITYNPVASFGTNSALTSPVLDLAAGDYLEAHVYQNSGGALNITYTGPTDQYSPAFSLVKVG